MNSAVVSDVERRLRISNALDSYPTPAPTPTLPRRKDDSFKRRSRITFLAKPARLSHERETERLHLALVSMSRGLLQYVPQCVPWSPADKRDRSAQLRGLAIRQQSSIQRLCDVLIGRGDVISWGVFPAEYTSYNYVSLDFLWSKVADSQKRVLRLLEVVRDDLSNNVPLAEVLDEIIQVENGILVKLNSVNKTEIGCVSANLKQTDRSVRPLRRTSRGQLSAI